VPDTLPPKSEQSQAQRRWSRLTRAAQQEVAAVLASLPQEVRERLMEMSVTFEPKPNAAMVANGIDADRTLGLFTVVSFACAIEVSQRLPPQIILFLDNILAYVRGAGREAALCHNGASFRRHLRVQSSLGCGGRQDFPALRANGGVTGRTIC
jgi:hypothetical protein